MSRTPRSSTRREATPHELVLNLETSIQTRLSAAEQASTEVAQAEAQAAYLLAEAAEQAVRDAQELKEGILADARAEAARLTEAGTVRAAELTAVTARRRDADVAAVVAAVLPARLGSAPEL